MAPERPRIYPHQTAHQAPANELRLEFTSPFGGGHLTLANTDDGRLLFDVTRQDSTVIVRVAGQGFDPRPVIAFMNAHPSRFSDHEFRHAASGKCLWLHEYGAGNSELCVYGAVQGSLYCAHHRDALTDSNPNTFGVKIPTDNEN
jgi:hypothetical protein